MSPGSSTALPVALKRRWWIVVLAFSLTALGGYALFYVTWHPTRASHWSLGAAGALAYVLGYTRVHLPLNRYHAEASVLPELGLSNSLTLIRGLLYGLLAGFVVLPAPSGLWAFVPGALYTVASLTDLLDGRIARQRGETTDLGAKLDVEVDSVGILVAFILGVKFQQVPPIFAGVGGLFYAYRLYLWMRRRRGHPVHPLPNSAWRSVIGGFEVGFLCVMLWPVFAPPYTTAVGAAIALPVVISFVWDGLIVTGRLDPEGPTYRRATKAMRYWLLGIVPFILRIAVGLALVWMAYYTLISTTLPRMGWCLALSMGGSGAVVAMGWHGRWSALVLLIASAFLSLYVPSSIVLAGIVASAFLLMMTGSGCVAFDKRGQHKDSA